MAQRFFDRALEFQHVDPADLHVLDHRRPVGKLRHVERRDVAQRDFHAFFRARRRDTADRVRRAFGDVGRAVDRIDRDVELRRSGQPGAELFAFENSGRVVLDPFADHDFAADVHEIEHAAHRVAGGGIGRSPCRRGRASESEFSAAASVARTKSNSMMRSMS